MCFVYWDEHQKVLEELLCHQFVLLFCTSTLLLIVTSFFLTMYKLSNSAQWHSSWKHKSHYFPFQRTGVEKLCLARFRAWTQRDVTLLSLRHFGCALITTREMFSTQVFDDSLSFINRLFSDYLMEVVSTTSWKAQTEYQSKCTEVTVTSAIGL